MSTIIIIFRGCIMLEKLAQYWEKNLSNMIIFKPCECATSKFDWKFIRILLCVY